MSEKLNAAFIFVAPGSDPNKHISIIDTPSVRLYVVGVKNYNEAEKVAVELVNKEKVVAVELCGGFGHEGVAMVSKAVGSKAKVGVVRFDVHPGLGNKSGDDFFK